MFLIDNLLAAWSLFRQLDEKRAQRLEAIDVERNQLYREFYKPYTDRVMASEDFARIDREYFALTAPLDNESEYLLQQPLLERATRVGVKTEVEWFQVSDPPLRYKVLSDSGVAALTRRIRQQRRDVVKDWVGIIMPVISGVIAILGLLVALKKK